MVHFVVYRKKILIKKVKKGAEWKIFRKKCFFIKLYSYLCHVKNLYNNYLNHFYFLFQK